MSLFLRQLLESDRYDGQRLWEFIELTFSGRKAQEDSASIKTLSAITNDFWELWIPVFVSAVVGKKSYEKDLLHLLFEFSSPNPSRYHGILHTYRSLRDLGA